jgi:hypothetical protein
MARIGTLRGTFLAPGVSRNHRRYDRENIGHAVKRMNARLGSGQTIPMHTSHKAHAEGDTRATAANVTKVYQDDAGAARFEADILPTDAGRDIAAMAVPDKDGKAALKTVSIFGQWVGDVTKDDQGNETAPDLDVTGIDFTHRPGVGSAQIDAGKLGESLPAGTVTESVDDLDVSLEEAKPSLLALLEAEIAHPMEDGLCTKCVGEADGAKPLTPAPKGSYADPGYQSDKRPRYPVDSAAHCRSALAYISKPKNAGKYTAAQLKRIKGKIHAAAKRFGIDVAKESVDLDETLGRLGAEFVDVIEAYASTSLDNGQGSISVSGYTDEPANLAKVATRIARAALAGLLALDPDNDGDIDIKPGDEDDDDDMEDCPSCGASFASPAMFCPQCGQPVPGAESVGQPKGASMPVHSADQVKALLTPEQAATLDATKTEYTTEELRVLLTPAPVTETAPAAKTPIELLAEMLTAKAAPVVEDDLTKARRVVAEADAAAAAKPVTLADLKTFGESIVEATTTKVREEVIEEVRRSGGITRRGLVAQARAIGESKVESDPKKLAEMSDEDFSKAILDTFDPLLPQMA